ncbi:MAG TPA: ATP-binding protein, partial [Polyangiaceae bacterium]|nr:ATP-binding protein [Polyangiaceae bacterium]
AISELRNVVLSLRGAVLDRRSALALLERRCRELCAPLELDFQVLGEASSSRASELEVPSEDLLLIAFELVRNAAQHSDGRLLVVALDVRSGLVLRVVDDGRGLPRHLWQSSHGGLKNVRDRVRELGGSIALEPSASGTHVVVTFARCDAAGLDRELGESSRFDESNRNQRSSSTVASRSRVS